MGPAYRTSERYQRKINDTDCEELSKIEGQFKTAREKGQVMQFAKPERSFLEGMTERQICGVSLNSRDVSQKLRESHEGVEQLNLEIGQFIASTFIIEGKELGKRALQLEEAQGKLEDLQKGIELNTRALRILQEAKLVDQIGKLSEEIKQYTIASEKLDGGMLLTMALNLKEAQENLQNLQAGMELRVKDLKIEEKAVAEEKKPIVVNVPKDLPKEADDLLQAIKDFVENSNDKTNDKLIVEAKKYYKDRGYWNGDAQRMTGVYIVVLRTGNSFANIQMDGPHKELLQTILSISEQSKNLAKIILPIFADAIMERCKALANFVSFTYRVDDVTRKLFIQADMVSPNTKYDRYTQKGNNTNFFK